MSNHLVRSLRRSRWRIYFLVLDFTSFNHDSFRDTISWECVVKDDCVRSGLIELKSFLLSKFYVDPIHRVLMSLPLFLLVPCKTRCFQVNFVRISVFFVHRIHRRKKYRLSFPQIWSTPVSILNLWWSVNCWHIRCDTCTRRNCSELKHCLVRKDQWDCVLNDLEELGDKEFLVLMDQYNIEIFSCCLCLLPSCSSIHHQTNIESAQICS